MGKGYKNLIAIIIPMDAWVPVSRKARKGGKRRKESILSAL